jgi:phosphomannomutase
LFYKLTRLKEIDYINNGDFIVRSVVTSKASDSIAEMFGVDVYESLTGFK